MTLPALIEALRRPEAYPHPVTQPVQVVETHVSWVLLTGPCAYKLKKPIKLPFLDYSTLARRKTLCDEETRLNRRYAPDLYTGTVVIDGSGDAPRVMDSSRHPLEYAVRMLQFDRSFELDALVGAGKLERTELADFGHTLGRFHAFAARAPGDGPFGNPEKVHRVTLDNFEEIGTLGLPDTLSPALDGLRSWVEMSYGSVRELMGWRRATGWIRECHGDLHCCNVVRWQGALTPFDGIEFDPALRFIDVVSDVAFLSMDLAARGREDLRIALLNAWCETLGDYAGLALLPYYEIYRALVRAKVGAIRGRQSAADPSRLRAEHAQVGRYLAWASLRAAKPGARLLLTCGLSGSGKTWLARQLSARLNAIHLRSDVERKRLAGLGPLAPSHSPPDAGIYTREFNAQTYARLRDCAQGCLKGGESVIVDAAFLRRAERRSLLALAAELDIPATILHCVAPLELMRERIRERLRSGADASEADVGLLDRQPSYWEPLEPEESAVTLEIDASRGAETLDHLVSQLHPPGA